LLFLYACTDGPSSMTLDQILAGHVDAGARPATITALADDAGIVFLPRLGEFRARRAGERVEIRCSNGGFEPDLVASPKACGEIEVCACSRDVLRCASQRADAAPDPALRAGLVARHLPAIRRAFELIAQAQPGYADCLHATLRRVALFESAGPNSFATLACQGMVFINTAGGAGLPFFVEDLAHQCGHVAFAAWTSEPARFMHVAPATPLRLHTGRGDDRRSVYEALHGIFTEAAMVGCLGPCLDLPDAEPVQRLEILARLGFILRRFGTDLGDLSRADLFSPAGERVLDAIRREFRAGYEACWDRVQGLDYSNQDYVFDFARFRAANDA
jgi:HEXXH motif-containing protein